MTSACSTSSVRSVGSAAKQSRWPRTTSLRAGSTKPPPSVRPPTRRRRRRRPAQPPPPAPSRPESNMNAAAGADKVIATRMATTIHHTLAAIGLLSSQADCAARYDFDSIWRSEHHTSAPRPPTSTLAGTPHASARGSPASRLASTLPTCVHSRNTDATEGSAWLSLCGGLVCLEQAEPDCA